MRASYYKYNDGRSCVEVSITNDSFEFIDEILEGAYAYLSSAVVKKDIEKAKAYVDLIEGLENAKKEIAADEY